MSTPATTLPSSALAGASAVRRQMAEATKRISRLKRIDRLAVAVITLGGIAVVIAVLGILVFIGAEALPLFRGASVLPRGSVPFTSMAAPGSVPAQGALGSDEYLRYFLTIEPNGVVVFRRAADGKQAREFPVPSMNGATVTASSFSLLDDFLIAGLSDGRVSLLQVSYEPVFSGETLSDVAMEVKERRNVQVDPQGRPSRLVSYGEQDGTMFAASLVGDAEIAYWWTDAAGAPKQRSLYVPSGQKVGQVRVGRNGNLVAGTDTGRVYHWEMGDEPVLTDVSPVSNKAVTALEWVLGGNSFIAGTADGEVSSWFRVPVDDGNAQAMVRAHDFDSQGAAITGITMSPRDRSFATAAADGSIVLRHQTSERTLATVEGAGAIDQLVIAPRSNALLARRGNRVEQYTVSNPHPETSINALFGKVWYEGYAQPEYVWQSTGATDDFEAKFSLVPLIFGTIKGTFYALLFAIPLAILSALYTSQFVHPTIRNRIKPTVEIMAALPSVVIGFLAGLYLATVIERNLAGVFLMMALMPLFGTAGVLVWRLLPKTFARKLPPGTEIFLIVPLLIAGGVAAVWAGPLVEATFLGTDTRQWLLDQFGITYDQRNSLVVGLAMGFAVIPIIFTISEDSFSSVPSNLTAASLALGASRWQTATRVVLPTASPGVFSAVMIGFGRAVGETMIVLMATGNTPLLDWSIFNGMRTLSANIAVEIPEAPHGGTLYRVLFLAATLLFVLTFAVNTIAELVRQRLRERYRAV
jgi:phosphate transport system permease protein